MDMFHGHASWTCFMDMFHGPACTHDSAVCHGVMGSLISLSQAPPGPTCEFGRGEGASCGCLWQLLGAVAWWEGQTCLRLACTWAKSDVGVDLLLQAVVPSESDGGLISPLQVGTGRAHASYIIHDVARCWGQFGHVALCGGWQSSALTFSSLGMQDGRLSPALGTQLLHLCIRSHVRKQGHLHQHLLKFLHMLHHKEAQMYPTMHTGAMTSLWT
jgi:hypothetical protein